MECTVIIVTHSMSLATRIADEKTFNAQRPGRRGGSMEMIFKQRSDERTADCMAAGSADCLSAASGLHCRALRLIRVVCRRVIVLEPADQEDRYNQGDTQPYYSDFNHHLGANHI
jgi:hypothetical protein